MAIKGQITANTATLSANVNLGFKVGLESKLATLSATPGTFYLTSDTHRLFIGDKDGNVCPVNQGVIAVTSLPDDSNYIPGQFYYLTGNNVLAIRSGNRWVQINPDTYVDELTHSVESATNGVTVKTSVGQAGGNAPDNNVEGSFTIVGSGDTTVSKDGSNVKIDTVGYSVGTAAASSNTAAELHLLRGTETVTQNSDKITIVGGTGIGVAVDATKKTITLTNSALNDITAQQVNDAAFTDKTDGGFELAIKHDATELAKATINPIIKLNSSATTASNGQYKFKNGIATLPVYTKTEVDTVIQNKLDTFNALTYKGSVPSSGLPTTNVAIGDTYVVTSSAGFTLNGVTYEPGTLLIATGTETNGKITSGLSWDVIASFSSDTATSVTATGGTTSGGKITLNNTLTKDGETGSPSAIGSMEVKAGGVLTAAGTVSGNDVSVTITHDKIGANGNGVLGGTTTGKAISDASACLASKLVITDMSVDEYGHVSSVSKEYMNVPTQQVNAETVVTAVTGTTKKTATSTVTVKAENDGAVINSSDAVTTITSSSLTLAAEKINASDTSTKAINIELTWGSF